MNLVMEYPLVLCLWALLGLGLLQLQSHGSLGCLEEEKVGLLKLKDAFKYSYGPDLSSWGGEESDCCRWEGVGCDNITQQVIQLSLHGTRYEECYLEEGYWVLNASLLDPFPELQILNLAENCLKGWRGVLHLNKLQVLDLNSNWFTELPSFSKLINLKYLDFSYNPLKNSSHFQELTIMNNLEVLNLSSNGIAGEIPSSIWTLTSLSVLDLSWNELNGTTEGLQGILNLKKLQYLNLSANSFTELPPLGALINLKYLEFSFNRLENLNHFQELTNLSNLEVLDLSGNDITGEISPFNWTLPSLTTLSIGWNQLNGTLPADMRLNSENLNMTWFDVSMNHIQGEVPSYMGTILPNLISLNMSGNELQGSIPPAVENMTMLQTLDLSSNNFSGLLPMNFLLGCISLRYLKLSNNSLQGQFLSTKSNLTSLQYMYLDNNHFSGEISPALLPSSKLISLDLSNNKISGRIPHWIGNFPELSSLILSRNSLEGPIPMGFCKLYELKFLDLSWNNFIDPMPSCLNLSRLRYLHLERNGYTGPIPNVISRSLSLVTLDMRNNNLSRGIPSWMSSLSSLRILLLKGNNLDGTIPFELCQLDKIRIIDLSHNNLFGPIPSCLNNMSYGMKGALDDTFSTSDYSYANSQPLFQFLVGGEAYGYIIDLILHEKEEVEFLSKSRSESYSGNILYFMSGMDLSSNKLTGSIPPEIGNLSGIHTLNFSYNHLNGSIPKTFSGLKNIESLDLSNNRLSGQIPTQLIELNFLSVFKVAYNNLSGKTPERKAQFATFDQSSYKGNPLLCGPPLEKKCTPTRVLPSLLPPSSDHEENDLFKVIFLWSFGAAYVVTFLTSIAFLYFNTYFQSLLSSFIYEYVLSHR
ncbi:hypothetical protein F0562_030167 [Nyssa sinensis]|uniref:Uncharacterized protein n=1 Tax=Nyssa sinensis TaxID=561372 RepID=A0A5J5AXN9_9ASTE|nr:hypothetical protein F0562_030167 [Nyssa sinensis]